MWSYNDGSRSEAKDDERSVKNTHGKVRNWNAKLPAEFCAAQRECKYGYDAVAAAVEKNAVAASAQQNCSRAASSGASISWKTGPCQNRHRANYFQRFRPADAFWRYGVFHAR